MNIKNLKEWLSENDSRKFIVMCRVNFQQSFPATLTRSESFRFCKTLDNSYSHVEAKIKDKHTIIIGL